MSRKREDRDDGRVIADMSAFAVHGYTHMNKKKKSREHSKKLMLYAVLLSLISAAVFISAAALFILFCTKIWLVNN